MSTRMQAPQMPGVASEGQRNVELLHKTLTGMLGSSKKPGEKVPSLNGVQELERG